jgi:FkbM family methyltransferase
MVVVDLVHMYVPPPRSLLRTTHVSGFLTTCDLSDAVQRSMFYRGLYEPYTSRMILEALPVGGTFLDIGANAGNFTLLAAAAVGPSGFVHAIEASPLNAQRLRADLEANGLTNRVALYEVGVADAIGTMRLQFAPGPSPHGMRYLDPGAAIGGEVVSITTVDELLPDLHADVVKVDVEGADLRVLRGMSKVLAAHPPKLLIVEVEECLLQRFGDSTAELVAFMRQKGYQPRELKKDGPDMLAFVPHALMASAPTVEPSSEGKKRSASR